MTLLDYLKRMAILVVKSPPHVLNYFIQDLIILLDSHDTSLQTPEANKIFIKQLEKKDKSHWQFDKLFPIWFILIALIMQSMIKDSDIFGVSTCSAIYWIVYILYILLWIVTMIFAVFMLNKVRHYHILFNLNHFKW